MKKVIYILGIVVFSAIISFRMNSILDKSDINLTDLMSFNSANAEVTTEHDGETTIHCDSSTVTCTFTFPSGAKIVHDNNVKH